LIGPDQVAFRSGSLFSGRGKFDKLYEILKYKLKLGLFVDFYGNTEFVKTKPPAHKIAGENSRVYG
jgi:hypothetical protein